ncbi:unnamed protein product [Schistosoma turkestanicum]|nr:unnamed protein product [Schistosoma turkestanicum]
MFPPSLPAPPNPAPNLSSVKNQLRRTSVPAISHHSYETIDNNNNSYSQNNKPTSQSNNEIIDLNGYHDKMHENCIISLPPQYLPQSPPQSLIAESISHSEFDSLLIANENISTENVFCLNETNNDSLSKSKLLQYSNESLLTTLVRYQNLTENCINHKLTRKSDATSQDTCFNSIELTSCDIHNPEKLPDQSCISEEIRKSHDQSVKVNLRNHCHPIEFNNTLEKKKSKTSNRLSMSNEQKITSPKQFVLDKPNDTNHTNIDLKHLSKVEQVKQCWENYFRPKPPRIARNKTRKTDSITQSVILDNDNNNNNDLTSKCLRSNSVDCTYRDYECKQSTEEKYDSDEYSTSSQCKALSTPVSPILTSNNNSQAINSTLIQSQFFPKETNEFDQWTKSKYTRKGYSPSFIRLIIANELDQTEQSQKESSCQTPQSLLLLSSDTVVVDQLNGRHSSSTLTLTENTATTKDLDSEKINSEYSTEQKFCENEHNVSSNENYVDKRLCRSNIEFSDQYNINNSNNDDRYSDYRIDFVRPQSLTLQRHCIHLTNNDRKLMSLSSSKSSDNFHETNLQSSYDNDVNEMTKEIKIHTGKYPYTFIDHTQTDDNLNKHAHWSRLYVEQKDRLNKNMNKKFQRNDNTQIDNDIIVPTDKYPLYARSYSADYNTLKVNPRRVQPYTIGIDRSESFDKSIKHISFGVNLNKKSNLSHHLVTDYHKTNLRHSFYSPVSTSSLICTSVNPETYINTNSFQLVKQKRPFSLHQHNRKTKITLFKDRNIDKAHFSFPIQLAELNKRSLSPRIFYDNSTDNNEQDSNTDGSDYDHENEQLNIELKMSLSPAAQRYEEHVLAATVSGRPNAKTTTNQIFFNDPKNYVTHQNPNKKVSLLLPECQYDNQPIEMIKNFPYHDEDSGESNNYQHNENLLHTELWREKLGAITRWRREVDDAMLAGETDLKEIFHSPEHLLHNNCMEEDEEFRGRSCLPNQHNTTNYLPSTMAPVNLLQSNGLYATVIDTETNTPTSCNRLLTQSYTTYSKPLIGGNEVTGTNRHVLCCSSNNSKPNMQQINSSMAKNMNLYDNLIMLKNYQPTNQAVPSKVVINPNEVSNNQTYRCDNNVRFENSQQINSKYQPMWIKAPIPQLNSPRQRSNSGSNAVVLQPSFQQQQQLQLQQLQNSTNLPPHYNYDYYHHYALNNNPVNTTPSNIQTSFPVNQPSVPFSNMNSSIHRHQTPTVKSFRNFFTPKLRRKTYELDKTEAVQLKQDNYIPTNVIQNNPVGQHGRNNHTKSMNERNNQLRKVVPSSSYTDALNLAVAANTALYEAFNQSIASTDSYQKTNAIHHNTPISFKQQKFKATAAPINPSSSTVNNNERPLVELGSAPIETGQIQNKIGPCQWTKIIKPHKNISLSPISSISHCNTDDNSPMEKQTDIINKCQNNTIEQTLYSNHKSKSPKLLLSDKSNDLIETPIDSRRTPGRLRSNLRHAVTLSPCRRKPDLTSEQCNSPYLQPSPLALSSGFVSAGSIVNAIEDSNEKMNKDEFTENSGKMKSVPPPVGVHDYPIVANLEKDLNTIESLINDSSDNLNNDTTPHTNSHKQLELPTNYTRKSINQPRQSQQQQRSKFNKLPPLQTLPPCKLLLGRVASNEDICIGTETPFSFNIAATDKEICITRVASVEDLKYQHEQQQRHDQLNCDNNNHTNNNKTQSIKRDRKRIPISLRLTFGSESKLHKSTLQSDKNDDLTMKNYRAMYYVDIPQGNNDRTVGELRRKTRNQLKCGNHLQNMIRYSLPCITYCEELPKPISLLPS